MKIKQIQNTKAGGGVMGLHSLYSLYEVGLVRNKTNLSTFTRCDLVKVGGKKAGVLRSCDVLRLVRKVGVVGFVVVNVLSLVLAPVGFLGPVKVAEAVK